MKRITRKCDLCPSLLQTVWLVYKSNFGSLKLCVVRNRIGRLELFLQQLFFSLLTITRTIGSLGPVITIKRIQMQMRCRYERIQLSPMKTQLNRLLMCKKKTATLILCSRKSLFFSLKMAFMLPTGILFLINWKKLLLLI